MVSGWLWLYFLITIILSVLIITWWLLVSRRKYREIQRNLGTADGLDGKVGRKAEFGTPSVQ